MYPIRFPLARYLGALGVPLVVRVEVICDTEAQVYVATSPDVDGLVVEAESLDELKAEVMQLIPELLALNHPDIHKPAQADLSFRQPLNLLAA